MPLPKYDDVELLHQGANAVVQRGVRRSDGTSVILKSVATDYPTTELLERFRHEFGLLRQFHHPQIIQPIELEEHANSITIVLHDHHAQPLIEWLDGSPCSIDDFLELSISIADALQVVHGAGVIHKDINPANIIIAPETSQAVLIDFGIASAVAAVAHTSANPDIIKATLAYVAPEQTGRMNRAVDHRSDLYSLGVTFYQMLAGRLPFTSLDRLELIHSHIARLPELPNQIRPEIPAPVADIVLKLMAKSADERYQSVAGLRHDLQRCREQWHTNGQIEPFPLGAQDVADRFQISDKLYGREREVEQLLSAFQRASAGGSELLLIAGGSGVGKSRLVNEVQKPIVEHRGYFLSGKFDQFKRNIPFSGLHVAFRELIRQIMAESTERVAAWREQINRALGSVGQVIVEVIPELELLAGPQPPVPDLPSEQSRNRFNQAFRRFVQLFCRPEHPLCIFLDDLQWGDAATLAWIEDLLADRSYGSLLLVGAYRANEVTASHPLAAMLDRLAERKSLVSTLPVMPLERAAVGRLIAETLLRTPADCSDLADLLFSRTEGNPFHITQLLAALHEDGVIHFDYQEHRWRYDISGVRNWRVTDNIVDLLTERLQRLTPQSQWALQVASCIGNSFDLEMLVLVMGTNRAELRQLLAEAVEEGLIVEHFFWSGEHRQGYRFLHDRVQQSAHSFLTAEKAQELSLQIGRQMLAAANNPEEEDHLFEIVDHLNMATPLIGDPAERARLVGLNLTAARRARNSTAYQLALHHAAVAMELVEPEALHAKSELATQLLAERAECEHQCGNNAQAEEFFKRALQAAPTTDGSITVCEQTIHFYTNLSRFADAYSAARAGVQLIGYSLPPKFIPPLFLADLAKARMMMRGRRIEDVVNLPTMSQPRQLQLMKLMGAVAKAAYQIRPELCVAIATKMVIESLRHGNAPDSVIGYLAYGVIFSGAVLGNHPVGHRYGVATRALIERFNNERQKAEVYFVGGYFGTSWMEPATESERLWESAYQSGVEVGDLFHAGCACSGTAQSLLMRGQPFDDILKTTGRFLDFLDRVRNRESAGAVRGVVQAIKNLRGETESNTSFADAGFNESAYLDELSTYGSRHFAHYYFINKTAALYLWGHHQQAFDLAASTTSYLKDSVGMLHGAEHRFYHALAAAALAESASQHRAARLRLARSTAKKFQRWAAVCPNNFKHKSLLLQAELQRATGNHAGAISLYNLAIEAASEFGYFQIQALANQRCAQLHLQSGAVRIVRYHLREAEYWYRRWGATAVADGLLQQYPEHLGQSGRADLATTGTTTTITSPITTTGGALAQSLDMMTVMKAAEAISGELRLGSLLRRLMMTVSENAGAQRAVLLRPHQGEWQLQAEFQVATGELRMPEMEVVAEGGNLPQSIIHFASHSKQAVVLNNAASDSQFGRDPAVQQRKLRSVLCLPLLNQGKLSGVIYLENNLTDGAFTQQHVGLLKLLSGQIAISIDNAVLYDNLEEKVAERTQEIVKAQETSERLLQNILPRQTAQELKATGHARARSYGMVSILFTDFVNFTGTSALLDPDELVQQLDSCFRAMDDVAARYNMEKIKTIGDAFMCAGGIPNPNTTNPVDAVLTGLAIVRALDELRQQSESEGKPLWQCRVGIHTGPVITGVVGKRKFAYDIWGDSVNVASRMESNGQAGRVNISADTYQHVKEFFACTHRGSRNVKGKGEIEMYFVDGILPEFSVDGNGEEPTEEFLQWLRQQA